MVLLKVSELGSGGIWIRKERSILGYEMERERHELDSGHLGDDNFGKG